MLARERARLASEAAKEKERLEAPRRYAASIYNPTNAPVYYFDANGDFQELNNERRKAPTSDAPPMKRVKRVLDRWVYGPNAKHKLEEGESELVTKVV